MRTWHLCPCVSVCILERQREGLGDFVNIVCPLSRQRHFSSALPSPHRSTTLSAWPSTNIRFRFFDVSASVSKVFLSHHILMCIDSWSVKNRVLFGSHDVDCDIRRKPPPTDTSLHKRNTQGKLLESVMSWRSTVQSLRKGNVDHERLRSDEPSLPSRDILKVSTI